jgi:transposase
MASPKQINIKESLVDLKRFLKTASPLIAARIRMLIELKQNEKQGISKRDAAALVGVNHNSVQTWRTMYINGGLKLLQSHNKKGFKTSVFSKEEHNAIEKKLKDPKNGLRGYVELQAWIEQEFKKQVKYNTLLKYSIKNFGSKVKVARKSHIKKDEMAVDTFKKTSVKSVRKRSKIKVRHTQK